MKFLTIIVGLLTITNLAYGYDKERLLELYMNIIKCSNELGISSVDIVSDTVTCIFKKDGRFLKNGKYIKQSSLSSLEDFISNKDNLIYAKMMFNNCYDNAVREKLAIGEETKKISECAIPILARFNVLK